MRNGDAVRPSLVLLLTAIVGCAGQTSPRSEPLAVSAGIGLAGIAITSRAGTLTKCDVTARDSSGDEWITRAAFSVGPRETIDVDWEKFTASNGAALPAYIGRDSRFTISCLDANERKEAAFARAD